MLDEHGEQCKHLFFEDGIAVCGITGGQYSRNTANPEDIPKRDYEFWLKHCKPYPRIGDLGHHKPPNCSFYRVYVKPDGEEVKLD